MAPCMIMAALIACSDMNDLHAPYLKDGETIYIGRALNPLPYSGKNRVKLVWDINADPKITQALIKWRDTEDHEVQFPITAVNGKVEQLVEGVQEGGYNFDIFMLGDNGERSVKVQVAAVSYGPKYESRLFSRTISSTAVATGKAEINWGPLTTGMLGTTLKYTTTSNAEKTIYIPPSTTKTTIADHKLGKLQFTYSTSFRPVQSVIYLNKSLLVSAIDTLNAGFVNGTFPN